MTGRVGATVGGRYRLTRLLGEGAAGTVWRAEGQLFGTVALKILRAELAQDPVVVERFVAEARAASTIAHPNVVKVFDLGRDAGVPFMVMELCDGETLAGVVSHRGAVGVAYACELVGQVLSALEVAHGLGIVHRDLKPGNVMVVHPEPDRPLIKVLDFGIAKSVHESEEEDERGVFGTPSCMAPEQIAGGVVDARSDLYSVGALLYELLTGRPPFRGATPAEVMTAVVSRPPKPLRAYDRSMPKALDALVRRCLSKNPDRRPATARALAQELAAFSDTPPGSVPPDRISHAPVPLVGRASALPPEPVVEPEPALPLVPKSKKRPVAPSPERPRLELVGDELDEPAEG
ncbi:MAG: serine/threonine protein kinase [Myxococcales bacterium]|nr:serine/threonine protein kinase [Myxococcales bacterium]